jgi:2-C-methyl-D-erythritol 4-phosphate cytidylyltransferase
LIDYTLPMPTFAAILPAAGSSTRYGGARNKLFEMLDGRTVLERSVAAFQSRDDVAMIVIPTHGSLDLSGDRIKICAGGSTRAHSVLCALREVPAEIEWVAVHDAARPLVSQGLIDRTLAAAVEHGAAVPALAVQLTIKQATGPLPAKVERTIPRQTLWAMQTPQIMRRAALLEAFENCPIPLDQVTDDVQLIELAGGEVWLVKGEERNLKITTASDLKIAEMHLRG